MNTIEFLQEIEREYIIGIVGDLGDGKTISGISISTILKILYRSVGTDKLLLTNVPVSYHHELLEYYHQLDNRNNCLIFIDEIHTAADSRMSMKKTNFFTSGITMDVRKFDNKLIWTSQESSQVEKRVRNRTKLFLHPIQIQPLVFDIALKNIIEKPLGNIIIDLNKFKNLYDTKYKPEPLLLEEE